MHEVFDLLCDKFYLYDIQMKSYCRYIYSYQFLTIAAFNGRTFDIYSNRVIRRRKKQMTFGSVCFQVVETGPFKHFFCSYFNVIRDFIDRRTTLVRSAWCSPWCHPPLNISTPHSKVPPPSFDKKHHVPTLPHLPFSSNILERKSLFLDSSSGHLFERSVPPNTIC